MAAQAGAPGPGSRAQGAGPHVGFALLTLDPGRAGGAETYVKALLEQFADAGGPPVTVLANRRVMDAYAAFARGPVALHPMRAVPVAGGRVARTLGMLAVRAAPRLAATGLPGGLDVVHYAVTVPTPRVSVPTVVTVHAVQHHGWPQFFSAAERWHRRWAYDEAARRATVVVVPSRHARDTLIERIGLDPDRTEIVPHGVDLRRFGPGPVESDDAALGSLSLPDRFVLYPANLWPHKNHARLLEAFAAVPDRDIALVLMGETYGQLPALAAQARRLGLGDRVRHVGFVAHDGMPALYRRASALVFPSLYEGFGYPPLEAMASGCPVASSRSASLDEVLGDAALTFDPEDPQAIADAIVRVTGDEDLRARLTAAGLEHVGGLSSPADAAERHRRVYERAAGLEGAAAQPPRSRRSPR